MRQEPLSFDALESRTVLSTLARMEFVLPLLHGMPESDVRLVRPHDGVVGATPSIHGWFQASARALERGFNQVLEHGFNAFENGNAIGWLKNFGDRSISDLPGQGWLKHLTDRWAGDQPGKGEQNQVVDSEIGDHPGKGEQKQVVESENDDQLGKGAQKKDEAGLQETASNLPSTSEIETPSHDAKTPAPTETADNTSTTPYPSELSPTSFAFPGPFQISESAPITAEISAWDIPSEAKSPTSTSEVKQELSAGTLPDAPTSEGETSRDASSRRIPNSLEPHKGMPELEQLEGLLGNTSFVMAEAEAPRLDSVELMPETGPEALTDVAVSRPGLEQAIQRFIDDLDEAARETALALSAAPAWVWVVVGAGVGTLGLARQNKRPRPAAIAIAPSWVPGLPPVSSQKA